MPALTEATIARLVEPYLRAASGTEATIPADLYAQLSLYLDLLLRWNARTNLTAIREPEEIVRRHFGESLLLAGMLPAVARSVLDLGSGAGFPGIPIQLLRPQLAVTLAESQGKKSQFPSGGDAVTWPWGSGPWRPSGEFPQRHPFRCRRDACGR